MRSIQRRVTEGYVTFSRDSLFYPARLPALLFDSKLTFHADSGAMRATIQRFYAVSDASYV